MSLRPVIVDVDVGTDDAWAILLLLPNETRCNFKIKAITCVFGNSSDIRNIGKNVLRLLEAASRLDVSSEFHKTLIQDLVLFLQIPVYLGCGKPLDMRDEYLEKNFHGYDGWCDLKHDSEPDMSLIQEKHAVNAMEEIISREKNVIVICLGPLTNLAKLYRMFPATSRKIEEIFIMGGSRYGKANLGDYAEFNFGLDALAASIVLESSPCLISLLPLETMENSNYIPKSWRFDVVGKIDNKITRLMNPVERKAYKDKYEWGPFDMYCAAAFIEPKIVRQAHNFYMTIELNGVKRGQAVIHHSKRSDFNVRVIEKIDVERLKGLVMETVNAATNEVSRYRRNIPSEPPTTWYSLQSYAVSPWIVPAVVFSHCNLSFYSQPIEVQVKVHWRCPCCGRCHSCGRC